MYLQLRLHALVPSPTCLLLQASCCKTYGRFSPVCAHALGLSCMRFQLPHNFKHRRSTLASTDTQNASDMRRCRSYHLSCACWSAA